jgi:sugar phosphate isomerase/epimerase
MRFGVCADIVNAGILRASGWDFLELNVQTALIPLESDEAFAPNLERIRSSALPCLAANCFVPGSLKITGPSVDAAALKSYAATTVRRAEQAGIRTIVFGSGAARRVPDGFSRTAAFDQIADFLSSIAPSAADKGVTVVIEPLHNAECNILTTVDECGTLCERVGHPSIRLLVDSYHWFKDNDSTEAIIRYGRHIAHVHIGSVPGRKAPGLEPCDWSPFMDALRKTAYDGTVSIEAEWNSIASEAGLVLGVTRSLLGAS